MAAPPTHLTPRASDLANSPLLQLPGSPVLPVASEPPKDFTGSPSPQFPVSPFPYFLRAPNAQRPALDAPIFTLRFTTEVRKTPFTGRILIFSSAPGGPEPRLGPNWFRPEPFYAVDVRNLAPGVEVAVRPGAPGFPASLGETLPPGRVWQAVLDQTRDHAHVGAAPGNGFSAPVSSGPAPLALTIDRVVPPETFRETADVKLLTVESRLLSRFHRRPMRLRAGIVLPEDYAMEPDRRYPTVYIVPGFGGTHRMALRLARSWPGLISRDGLNALVVVLDPTAYTGHHVFADSANNGPVGRALVDEFIPAFERQYRADPHPSARLLTGHSSGGWSTLWLQVAYPDTFGGVWSTSPDPVDFRDFQQIDLYAPNANVYTDPQGRPRPLARRGDQPVLWYKDFVAMETVLGHGGQIQSFEAVFSPRRRDGRPRPLFDRATGAVDHVTARAWQKYDLNLKLQREWPRLAPKLAGKLHVYTGAADTFYLEGAVRLLQQTLTRLGSDARVEVIPGKDHGTLLDAPMRARIAAEMRATVRERTSARCPRPEYGGLGVWVYGCAEKGRDASLLLGLSVTQ